MNFPVLTLCLLLLAHETLTAPLQDTSSYQNMLSEQCIQCLLKDTDNNKIQETNKRTKTFKKDVFVSRGWGAGGMPFSVLYMNPSHSSKAPVVETFHTKDTVEEVKPLPKSVPQVRNSMRQKSIHRISHSVIPQLFVSYGWGPHGKK